MSHRNVTKIEQDTSGFIWLATVNGLNKYDGYNFTHYRAEGETNSIAANYITDMVITEQNEILLSHPNNLSLLNAFSNTVQTGELSRDATRGGEKTAFDLLHTGYGNFATVFDESSGESTLQLLGETDAGLVIKKFAGQYNTHAICLSGENLYVAAGGRILWKFDISSALTNSDFTPTEISFPHPVLDLYESAKGDIFVLTEKGALYRKQLTDVEFHRYPLTLKKLRNNALSKIFIDKDENIWLAGRGVLYQWNYTSGEWLDLNEIVQQTTKYAPNYRQIYQDKSGVIWIASDLGAIKASRTDKLFSTYLNGGNEYCSSGFCSMRGMTEDEEGNIYLSYYNSLHKLEKTTGVLLPLFPRNNFRNSPFGLAYCQGALWTGNGRKIELKNGIVDSLFDNRVDDKGAVIAVDNHLWFAYENKITQYFPSRDIRIEYSLSDTLVKEITFLHKGQKSGSIWVGTQERGVFEMSSDGRLINHWHTESLGKILRSNRILGLYEAKDASLWVATAAGLDQISRDAAAVRHFNVETGLPNNFINAVQPEGDSILWLSTDNGLARLNPQTGKVESFFKKDGLPANEFNRMSSLRTSDGRLFFGGLNGAVAFYPNAEFGHKEEENVSNLLLTSFSKFDGQADSLLRYSSGIMADSLLNLSWRDKFFTFNFALADFNNPEENRYSYFLEGYDKNWSEKTRLNSARYNNLPAGDYVFRVRGAAGTDDWNAQELRLPIHIEEAFYKKISFLLGLILFLTGLVYAFMRYRLHIIKQREKLLEKQVSERTRELAEEKQVSDNLLLNILPAETAEELKKYGSTKAKRYEQVTVFFSDFKDFTKIAQQLEPEQLVAEIDFCFRHFDAIIEKYGLEKIKTIGDAYMCTAGMKGDHKSAAINMVKAALEIQEFIQSHSEQLHRENRPAFEARVGLHTGPVVAGIVGSKKFAYDIWGDTVNIASRMESHGQVGKVNISQTTYELVKSSFSCTPRGKVAVKNKGETEMYFVEAYA